MGIEQNDFFYCIKDNYSMEGKSVKGWVYYVDAIYLYKDGSGLSDFDLKSASSDKDGEYQRFKILCENGQPIERFHDYFITQKEWIRNNKIDKLIK